MAFDELKQRHAQIWGSAPFERVAEKITDLHAHLVEALEPQPGEEWLDVGTGTGGVALRAAQAGAKVTGCDIAPELVETAKRLAADEGLEIRFEVGDAERLPYEDASFDVVSSSVGTMFAPDHSAVARELARVTRPGGRLGLIHWDPEGGIGDLFRLLAKYQPPPPEGAGVPVDWGREEYVQGLLGDAFELRFVHANAVQKLDSAEQDWELMLTSFGPLKTLYGMLDESQREELHADWVERLDAYRVGDGIEAPREYLLVLGARR
jgi:SAM-dependent methyltransferase